ncbi:hypothetical protein CGCSCA5_v010292 [Colletotrichum siamense]|nr:hypothetical protein CGCSCA5_v010292 [Colletotrichum siamense]
MAESTLTQYGFRFADWAGGEASAQDFGVSHAVVVPPNASRIIVGGQLGIKDDGSIPENIEDEVKEAFEHVSRSLKAAGLGDDAWEHVYSVKTFEVAHNGKGIAGVVIPIAKSYLKNTRPVWTGVEVKSLVFPGLHIEITVEAYLPK